MSAAPAIYPQEETKLDTTLLDEAKSVLIDYARRNYTEIYYSLCAELDKVSLCPFDFAYVHSIRRGKRIFKQITGNRIGEGWELFSSGGWRWDDYVQGGFFAVDSQEADTGNLAYRGVYLDLIPADKGMQCTCMDRYNRARSCGFICKHMLCKLWVYVALCHYQSEHGKPELDKARLDNDLAARAAKADLDLWG